MSNLDNRAINPNEFAEWHKVTKWGDQPSKNVGRGDVREKSVRLDHRDCVHGKEKLVLLIGILHNTHEGIRQNGDEDGDDDKVTNEQEHCQDEFAQHIIFVPKTPCCWSKTHEHLKQGICDSSRRMVIAVAKSLSERHEKPAAGNDNQKEDRDKVRSHDSKCDKQLRKVAVVVKNREKSREEKDCICGQDVIRLICNNMIASVGQDDTIKSHAIVAEKEEKDTEIEKIPKAHEIQAETLLVEPDNLVEHKASTPKPEDNLQWSNFEATLVQHSQEQSQQNRE